jgi:putative phage-type endonuclease
MISKPSEVILTQGSEKWHGFRSLGIGGSDANIIAGQNAWTTIKDLWAFKAGLVERTDIVNEAMQHGIDLEPVAREAFIRATDLNMTPKCFINTEHDFIRASLDGIDDTHSIILEIKCPTKLALHMKVVRGSIPDYYYPQVQHQLFVTGAEVACFWSYTKSCGGFMIEIEPDLPYIKELVRREKLFWQHVLDKTEPDEMEFTSMT